MELRPLAAAGSRHQHHFTAPTERTPSRGSASNGHPEMFWTSLLSTESLDNLVSFYPAWDQLCGYVPIDGGEFTFLPDR